MRATVPHARLKHRLGYAEAALGELRAIYGWFTEGLELPDLLERECAHGIRGKKANIKRCLLAALAPAMAGTLPLMMTNMLSRASPKWKIT